MELPLPSKVMVYRCLKHWHYNLALWVWGWFRSRCRGRGICWINLQKPKFLDEFIGNQLVRSIWWVVFIPEHVFAPVFTQCWCRYTCECRPNTPEWATWGVRVLKSWKQLNFKEPLVCMKKLNMNTRILRKMN